MCCDNFSSVWRCWRLSFGYGLAIVRSIRKCSPVVVAAVTVKECWQVAVFYQPTEPVREGGGRMEHFLAAPLPIRPSQIAPRP
ncbi:hypothetical protein CEXT_493661 [Caerostris extrusa]|uniref:Secreted protein n=1 Tax=Caerostris extrusa TaxID=172846 RepID=A0AAV4PDD6_CAEEX|nr:hypothetical protein CEXT_493661 [Caerostris extrusa]